MSAKGAGNGSGSGAGNSSESLRIKAKKSNGVQSPVIWQNEARRQTPPEKGLVGTAYSFNYIPYPKRIPISSGKNLKEYKKAFIETWKEYYNMGSRRHENNNRKRYANYVVETFHHLKPRVLQERQAIIDALHEEGNKKLNHLYTVLKPAKEKEINDKYEILLADASQNIQEEAYEYGTINLGFLGQSEYDQVVEDKERELANLEQSVQDEEARINQEYQQNVAAIDTIFLSNKVKYDYMRDVVENKLLGYTPSMAATTTTSSSSSTTTSTNNSYPTSQLQIIGEAEETPEKRRKRQENTLRKILAGKKSTQGGSRRRICKNKTKRKQK